MAIVKLFALHANAIKLRLKKRSDQKESGYKIGVQIFVFISTYKHAIILFRVFHTFWDVLMSLKGHVQQETFRRGVHWDSWLFIQDVFFQLSFIKKSSIVLFRIFVDKVEFQIIVQNCITETCLRRGLSFLNKYYL